MTDTTDYAVQSWTEGLMMELIRKMIGTPPPGYEYLEYAVACAIFIILFALVASVFVGFSKLLGAK